ncbi:MAG: hypothetical protein K5866_03030, partial [Treponema sp.]|nr:hypothetical protein [Treponema sp.]
MLAYIALILSIFVLFLLIILLIRFKKLFSTEKILEKITLYMEKRLTEINSITSRDLDLLRASSENIHNLLDESEVVMKKYQEATNRLRDVIAQSENSGFNLQKKEKMNSDLIIDINKTKKEEKSPSDSFYTDLLNKPVIVKSDEKAPDTKNYIKVNEDKRTPLTKKIIKLHERGLNIEEISEQLSCSIS